MKKEVSEKKSNRLGWQLISMILLTIIIPSVVFLAIIVKRYSNDLLDQAVTERKNVLQEINRCVEISFRDYQELSLTFYYNPEIKALIDSGAILNPDEEQLATLKEAMATITNSKNYVDSLVLCFGDATYDCGKTFANMDEYREKYEKRVMNREGRTVWLPTENLQSGMYHRPQNFALARVINDQQYNAVGTFYMFVSTRFFDQIMTSDTLTRNGSHYYVVDRSGQIVISDTELTGTASELPFPLENFTESTGSFYVRDGRNSEQVVTYACMDTADWISVIVTDSAAISENAKKVEHLALLFVALYILVMTVGYFLIRHIIILPVRRLHEGMRGVSEGQFQPVAVPPVRNEVSDLTSGYNDMVYHIQSLLERIREEEAEKNRQRIKVLYMQVGPHFLYNTLNSIKWMAVLNNQPNIKAMVDALMKLMAGVTYNKEDEIPLKKELELLDSYVHIQKVRFSNVKVEYDIPEDLMNLLIGRFMLQPFVENSILHGLRGLPAPGVIRISARIDERMLVFEITDNGRGFNPASAAAPKTGEEEKDHVGIENVRERIRIHYGEAYGVEIQSEPGTGTRVRIRLPIHDNKEENKEVSES